MINGSSHIAAKIIYKTFSISEIMAVPDKRYFLKSL